MRIKERRLDQDQPNRARRGGAKRLGDWGLFTVRPDFLIQLDSALPSTQR